MTTTGDPLGERAMVPAARFLVGSPPLPEEGLPEWLIRLSGLNGCSGSRWIMDVAGLPSPTKVEAGDVADRLGHVVGMDPGATADIVGAKVSEAYFLLPRWLTENASIRATNSRVCAICLRERDAALAAWRHPHWVACPVHGCEMVECCTKCGMRVTPGRRAPGRCGNWRCDADLSRIDPRDARPEELAVVALLGALANRSDLAERSSLYATLGRPDVLGVTELIAALGSAGSHSTKPLHTAAAYRDEVRRAAAALDDWPNGFHSFLGEALPRGDSGSRPLRENWPRLYAYCCGRARRGGKALVGRTDATRELIRTQFNAFLAEFGVPSMGVLTGRMMNGSVNDGDWVSLRAASLMSGLDVQTIERAAERGQIQVRSVLVGGEERQVVSRASVDLLVRERTCRELASLRDVMDRLGLLHEPARALASAGFFDRAERGRRLFYSRCSLEAFVRDLRLETVPVVASQDALKSFMKVLQGRQRSKHELDAPKLVGAIATGALRPVGRLPTNGVLGGLLFDATQVRTFVDVMLLRRGFVGPRAAAKMLVCRSGDVGRLRAAHPGLAGDAPASERSILLSVDAISEFLLENASLTALERVLPLRAHLINRRMLDSGATPVLTGARSVGTWFWRLDDVAETFGTPKCRFRVLAAGSERDADATAVTPLPDHDPTRSQATFPPVPTFDGRASRRIGRNASPDRA